MTSLTPFLGPLTPKISKIQSGQKNLKKIMVTRFRFEMTKIFFVRQFFLSFGVQGPLWSKKWLKRALKRGQRVKKFKSAFFCVFGYKMNTKNFGLEFKHQHPTRWHSALHYKRISDVFIFKVHVCDSCNKTDATSKDPLLYSAHRQTANSSA